MKRLFSRIISLLVLPFFVFGCARYHKPYVGVNPVNSQFERGRPFLPLDLFGHFISLPYDLLFWTNKYGNHNISPQTEAAITEFIQHYELTDVKVRINQWAPHKEIARLITNKHIAWPYKFLFFPSTLIVSIIARPFSGLIISDYFDPGSNTINIFSDEIPIALHEAGHAKDFAYQKFKGTYSLVRILPGVNLFQENIATDEALYYLEETKNYDELLRGYKILYPAYSTYIVSYISANPVALVGAIVGGHVMGRMKASDKEWQLRVEGKWNSNGSIENIPSDQIDLIDKHPEQSQTVKPAVAIR